jgi:hypothetical protein
MRIATQILGGIIIALLMIAIIFTFVEAKSVINKGAEIAEGEEHGGIAGLVSLFAALGIVYVGTIVYYLMIVLGVVEILYMAIFGFAYYKLFTGIISVDVNKWNGIIFGIVFFFSIFVFAFSPKDAWGIFVITLLLASSGIAYSMLSSKLHKKKLLEEASSGEYEDDEIPQLIMDEE